MVMTGIFGAVGAFAQVKQTTMSKEQKMLPFAVGMSLSVLGEMHDENYASALAVFQKDMPTYSAALKPVVELRKDAADYVRLDVAQTATKALRSQAGATEKWLLLVGERFGSIYVQIKKSGINDTKIDADELKFSLDLVSTLAGNAPKDVPQEIAEKIAAFGKLKDHKTLGSDASIEAITEKVMEILSAIES